MRELSLIASADWPRCLSIMPRVLQGFSTGDYPRFGRLFWEMSVPAQGWELQQSTVNDTVPYGGREHILFWEDGKGELWFVAAAHYVRGLQAVGRKGVAVAQIGGSAIVRSILASSSTIMPP